MRMKNGPNIRNLSKPIPSWLATEDSAEDSQARCHSSTFGLVHRTRATDMLSRMLTGSRITLSRKCWRRSARWILASGSARVHAGFRSLRAHYAWRRSRSLGKLGTGLGLLRTRNKYTILLLCMLVKVHTNANGPRAKICDVFYIPPRPINFALIFGCVVHVNISHSLAYNGRPFLSSIGQEAVGRRWHRRCW